MIPAHGGSADALYQSASWVLNRFLGCGRGLAIGSCPSGWSNKSCLGKLGMTGSGQRDNGNRIALQASRQDVGNMATVRNRW
jgi:hypothetical protein